MKTIYGQHGLTKLLVEVCKKTISNIHFQAKKKTGPEDHFWSTRPDEIISSGMQEKLSQIDIFKQKKTGDEDH